MKTVEPGSYAVLYKIRGKDIGLIKDDPKKRDILYYCEKHVPELEPTRIWWTRNTPLERMASYAAMSSALKCALPFMEDHANFSDNAGEQRAARLMREAMAASQRSSRSVVANKQRGRNQTTGQRTLESALYRLAKRKGFRLVKYPSRTPSHPEYGHYQIAHRETNAVAHATGPNEYGLTLADVVKYLKTHEAV